jgi:hypothetical protein
MTRTSVNCVTWCRPFFLGKGHSLGQGQEEQIGMPSFWSCITRPLSSIIVTVPGVTLQAPVPEPENGRDGLPAASCLTQTSDASPSTWIPYTCSFHRESHTRQLILHPAITLRRLRRLGLLRASARCRRIEVRLCRRPVSLFQPHPMITTDDEEVKNIAHDRTGSNRTLCIIYPRP